MEFSRQGRTGGRALTPGPGSPWVLQSEREQAEPEWAPVEREVSLQPQGGNGEPDSHGDCPAARDLKSPAQSFNPA